jgi:predicted membrane protein
LFSFIDLLSLSAVSFAILSFLATLSIAILISFAFIASFLATDTTFFALLYSSFFFCSALCNSKIFLF